MSSPGHPPSPRAAAAAAAAGPVGFWDLPCELRDMIYEEYARVDGGYVHDAASGKLRPATPRPHAFALQRTCRRAAAEMAGVPLRANTLTFSTVCVPGGPQREDAFRFDFMLNKLRRQLRDLADRVFDDDCYGGDDDDDDDDDDGVLAAVIASFREAVRRDFAEFLPALDARAIDDWFGNLSPGVAHNFFEVIDVEPSRLRDFFDFLARHFRSKMPLSHRFHKIRMPDRSLFGEVWDMPCKQQLDRMADACRPFFAHYETDEQFLMPVIELDRIWDKNRFKYRFSAAAAAIQFLRRHPSLRPHMRRLVLVEDRESVAFPESHCKGLIPFCAENPRLRIERRLDFVRNLLSVASPPGWHNDWAWTVRMEGHGTFGSRVQRSHQVQDAIDFYQGWESRWPDHVDVSPRELTQHLSEWILEAAVLPECISLVLDGSYAPEHCSDVFRRWLIPRAIYQEAWAASYRRGLLPKPKDLVSPWAPGEPWVYRGLHHDTKEFSRDWWWWRIDTLEDVYGYVLPQFPNMIRDIIQGSGRVRCNLTLDPLLQDDVERLISERSAFTIEDWEDHKEPKDTAVWVKPLGPILRALATENTLPDESVGAMEVVTSKGDRAWLSISEERAAWLLAKP